MKSQDNQQSIYCFNQQNQSKSSYKIQSFKRQKSKSKLTNLKTKHYYLTDTQASSSDHTKSSSEINLAKLEYESKLKKLQKQNFELKQAIIKYRKYEFYELDEQKVKQFILQNQMSKRKINQLQSEMIKKQDCIIKLQNYVSELQVQNQYLDRNNKIIKDKFQKILKLNIKEKNSIKQKDYCQYCTHCNQIHHQQYQKRQLNKYLKNIKEQKKNEECLNPFVNPQYQSKLIKFNHQQKDVKKNAIIRKIKSGQKSRSNSKSIYKFQTNYKQKKTIQNKMVQNCKSKNIKGCLKSARSYQGFNFPKGKETKNEYFKCQQNNGQGQFQKLNEQLNSKDYFFKMNTQRQNNKKNIVNNNKKSVYFN